MFHERICSYSLLRLNSIVRVLYQNAGKNLPSIVRARPNGVTRALGPNRHTRNLSTLRLGKTNWKADPRVGSRLNWELNKGLNRDSIKFGYVPTLRLSWRTSLSDRSERLFDCSFCSVTESPFDMRRWVYSFQNLSHNNESKVNVCQIESWLYILS